MSTEPAYRPMVAIARSLVRMLPAAVLVFGISACVFDTEDDDETHPVVAAPDADSDGVQDPEDADELLEEASEAGEQVGGNGGEVTL